MNLCFLEIDHFFLLMWVIFFAHQFIVYALAFFNASKDTGPSHMNKALSYWPPAILAVSFAFYYNAC